MSHPNLIKPRAYQAPGKAAKGDPKFSVEGIFDIDSLSKWKTIDEATGKFVDCDIKAVVVELIKARFPGISVKDEFIPGKNWPFANGDVLVQKAAAKTPPKKADHYAGKTIIRMSSSGEYPPNLYVRENGERKRLTRGLDADEKKASGLFVAGSYAFAEVNIKPQETPQGKFVTFYLNSISYSKPGDRIGGQSMMDRFSGVEGGESDHNPTEGMDGDDDIPY